MTIGVRHEGARVTSPATDEPIQQGIRTWRAEAVVPVPKALLSDLGQGPPQQLNFGSRIATQHIQIDEETDLYFGTYDGDLNPDWGLWEPASITFRIRAASVADAQERIVPNLELVLDDLIFQFQEPLRVVQLELLDITGPVAVEEEREFFLLPFPNGYDQFKLSRSNPMGACQRPLPRF
jgi:hypothetical protein